MIGKGANEIRPATLAEVEKILEKRQGTAGEFGFEQQTTLDYAKKFAKLKLSEAQELAKELEELGVKPETAVKLADVLPINKGQFALILAKDRASLTDKKVTEIEELVAKYSKKAKKIESSKAPLEEVKPAEAASPAAEKPAEKTEDKKAD
ncbi:MAG: DNA-directed RNA polymerase subunit F [Candidatus Micrarchaeia archaeon]